MKEEGEEKEEEKEEKEEEREEKEKEGGEGKEKEGGEGKEEEEEEEEKEAPLSRRFPCQPDLLKEALSSRESSQGNLRIQPGLPHWAPTRLTSPVAV